MCFMNLSTGACTPMYLRLPANGILAPQHLIYLLTTIGLTHSGSSTVHIYIQKCTEQHNETEYAEQNIHNNKNT